MMKHIVRSISIVFFLLFSASVASAQTKSEGEACLQATQSSADALYAEDWISLISLKKRQQRICWWDNDPASLADSNSTIGVAYYQLGDLNKAKIAFTSCVSYYYSEPNCHYWLAVIARDINDFSNYSKEKEIAKKIALRIISEGLPNYTKDEIQRIRLQTRIDVAKLVIEKLGGL